jgi:hypothetical protein
MRPQPSCSWVHHVHVANVPPSHLSDAALDGLEYAEQLAASARAVSEQNLRHYTPDPPPLTIQEIADATGISPGRVASRIARARRELFGPLSDGAIRKRDQRRIRPRHREPRTCDEPGCTERLPPDAHGNQRYCFEHATASARVKRHRAQPSKATQS